MAKIYFVDSFTTKAFSGNPAAICLLSKKESFPSKKMQNLAKEINFSETAFIKPINGNIFSIRWFTPTTEVGLCGHATLAASAILPKKRITFRSRSGPLYIIKKQKQIVMDFPLDSCKILSHIPKNIRKAIPLPIVHVAKSKHRFIVEVKNEQALRNFRPNFSLIKKIPTEDIVITSRSSTHYDFISRCFAPQVGIDEDPVTGSAHTTLASYWNQQTGKTIFHAYQASKRGGEMLVEIKDQRVHLTGSAVILFSGRLN